LGVVDAVGDGVQGIAPGDRVAALSYKSYGEYDVADADKLVKLPAKWRAVSGEPLGCAFNIFRRSDIREGQTVAIVGIGFLGAVLTRLATGRRCAGDRHFAAAVQPRPRAALRRGGGDTDGRSLGDHRAREGADRPVKCAIG
jgi:D-arabinose 1-dehydrogenase-like Zn-dependent alcohol dehydrogenase